MHTLLVTVFISHYLKINLVPCYIDLWYTKQEDN